MSEPNHEQRRQGVSRRRFLQGAAGSAAFLVGAPLLAREQALAQEGLPFNADANPVTRENRLSPQSSWTEDFQLGPSKFQDTVSGFATKTSVNKGEDLQLKLNSYDPASTTATLRVYRLGYYGGTGGRLALPPISTTLRNQGFLPSAGPPAYRQHDTLGYATAKTAWAVTDTIPTGNLTSGMYLLKVTSNAAGRNENHIPFIVRDDARPRDMLVAMPTNTWQAYNSWAGKSLYLYNSYNKDETVVGSERAAKLAFDRPWGNVISEYNWVLRTEFPLIWWLERQGYDLAYTDDFGLHSQPQQLLRPTTKTLALAGHAEYWTKEMRDNVQGARDAGTNIASFSANAAYWQVRLEDGGRDLVCFKTVQSRNVDTPDGGKDGVNDFGPAAVARGGAQDSLGADGRVGGDGANADRPDIATTTFRDDGAAINDPDAPDGVAPRAFEGLGRVSPNRPENELFGVMYFGDDDVVSYPLQVPAGSGTGGEYGSHPAWRHTTLANGAGDSIGSNLIGWEWDAIPKGGAYASYISRQPAGVKRVATSNPAVNPPPGNDLEYLRDAGHNYEFTPDPGQGTEVDTVTYRHSSGAMVFAAGTIQWSWGLGPHFEAYRDANNVQHTYEKDFPRVDSFSTLNGAIAQATHNILVDGGVSPATPEGVTLDIAPTPEPQPEPQPEPPMSGPPVVTPRDTKPPKVKIPRNRRAPARGRDVHVRISSSPEDLEGCKGHVTLYALVPRRAKDGRRLTPRRVRLGRRRSFTLGRGKSARLIFALSRGNRALLRRRGRLTVQVEAEVSDYAGNTAISRVRFGLYHRLPRRT